MPDLIVVSNTTPIITLLGIGKLEILQKLYGKIFIPQAVAKEVLVGENKFAFVDLEQIGWVVIKKVENELLLKTFLQDLDEGEAEALVLAIEMKADILLIDEKIGRNLAHKKNIKLSGTLGVILKAKEKGFIESVKPLLSQMLENKIWLSETLIQQILLQAGEL